MSIVLTKTFILLLYLQSIKNSPKEPFMLSVVKKMCTYRDAICKGQKTGICTSRIINDTLEYKFFYSTCYLFLSNICDQPDNEFNIISEGSCSNLSRRKIDRHTNRHTEESTKIKSKQSIYKKHKNNVGDFENGDMVYDVIDDDDKKLAGRKFDDEESNDKDKSSDINNNKVTSMPKITLIQDSSEPSEGKKRKEEREHTDLKEQRKTKKVKRDKTMKHSHHARDKHLRKYTSKNEKHKITKNHHNHHRRHHHHHQRPKKSTSTKTKLRSKRHSIQKSESGSHKHIHFRSYNNKSLGDNKEKSEEFQSVNADDNDDKTPEEVSSRDDEDDGETKEDEIRNKSEFKEDGNETVAKTAEIKQKTKKAEEENEGTNEVNQFEQSRESDLEKKLQNSDTYVRSGSREIFSTSIEKTRREISEDAKSNDKSEQESYHSENQDENVSDNENNDRRSLRHNTTLFHTHNKIKKKNRQSLQHRKSKIGNKKKHKNKIKKRQQNITFDKHYDKKDTEEIKDFEHLNKSRIILSKNLHNKSQTIIFMVGDNITISDAASLYKLLTGNVSTNSQMSDKVDINGTAPNSIITDEVNVSVKNLNNDFTELQKSTNSVDKVQMKANNNETNQTINHISEDDEIQNDKSGQGTESTIESGISTDKSVSDRSSENHTISDHSTDRIDNYEIIENTDTTTTNSLLDYDDIGDLNIDRKFRLDVRNKLMELNLTDSNIDQYNETLMDIADFNHLIDAIDIVHGQNKERIDEAKLGVSEEKHLPIEVETKSTHRIVDNKESNIERDIKLQEFIEESIGRIENVQDKDNPSLRGNFRRNVWMDIPDLVDLAL